MEISMTENGRTTYGVDSDLTDSNNGLLYSLVNLILANLEPRVLSISMMELYFMDASMSMGGDKETV
jgi:hypothetical protein